MQKSSEFVRGFVAFLLVRKKRANGRVKETAYY
jgi:hypothetical protein